MLRVRFWWWRPLALLSRAGLCARRLTCHRAISEASVRKQLRHPELKARSLWQNPVKPPSLCVG